MHLAEKAATRQFADPPSRGAQAGRAALNFLSWPAHSSGMGAASWRMPHRCRQGGSWGLARTVVGSLTLNVWCLVCFHNAREHVRRNPEAATPFLRKARPCAGCTRLLANGCACWASSGWCQASSLSESFSASGRGRLITHTLCPRYTPARAARARASPREPTARW